MRRKTFLLQNCICTNFSDDRKCQMSSSAGLLLSIQLYESVLLSQIMPKGTSVR